ncbi:MAG: hypothetical protein KKF58_00640 [Gammaproteobacteria bacterium]|nr:hypothetical protein [Gammaproteobacteria bacterium]MBU1446794.1 hypothetical protein [Gammaproteobacteria bacterium]
MKKIVLSLAGVMAAVAFAPEATAVPVFARQTGMACSACHFQHFPMLNGFGRAFKANGFSMVGSQEKVEGEHLSIPSTLNMAVLTSTYYQRESKDTSGLNAKPSKWGVPGSGGELSIFYGGRIADGAGFLSEFAAGESATGAAKLAMMFPVGDANVGIVAYTGGQGAAYSFELLNTGAADTQKLMGNAGPNKQHVAATSAASWLGARTNATGVSAVVNSDMGFAVLSKFAPAGPNTSKASDLPLSYVRAAAIFDMQGWDSAVGFQNFSGTADSLGLGLSSYKATIIDAQAQGEVNGMALGVYASYGTAPTDVNGNNLAGGWSTLQKTGAIAAATSGTGANSLNVAASLELIPGVATVQGGMRFATLKTTGGDLKDNAFMIGGTYELAQNIELGLNYTSQSGTAWDANPTAVGKSVATALLEVLF